MVFPRIATGSAIHFMETRPNGVGMIPGVVFLRRSQPRQLKFVEGTAVMIHAGKDERLGIGLDRSGVDRFGLNRFGVDKFDPGRFNP